MGKINWARNRDILISIICVGVIVWFAWGLLFGEFVTTFVLLLLSLAVSFLLTPFVNLLDRFMPRILATLVAYVLTIAVLVGLSYAIVFSLIQQVLTFQDTVINFFNNLPSQYNTLIKFLLQQGIPQANITDALNQVKTQATSFATSLASNALNIVFIVTNTFIDIIIVLVMSFYFTLDGEHIRNSLMSIFPERYKKPVELFEESLNRVVGNYIRGQLTLAVIIGILAGVGCAFLGLRSYALIIGVLAFIFETIPMVGPTLASIPAILISLLLPDPFPRTFWIIIYFICVQAVESNILGPRIVGHAVGLHPIASLLALIIGAQLFGAFGALLATPLVAAAWVVISSLYRSFVLGQSADEILATSKKKGWVLRRPMTRPLTWPRKMQHAQDDDTADDTPESDFDGQGFSKIEKPVTSVNLDHIDLLRNTPNNDKS
ncbi:MAG: AI-2E family transporter [Ktedonobacteraceae bacterium]